jgi:epsilon-lactone hydrolase
MPSAELERAFQEEREYGAKLAEATDLEEIRNLDASVIPTWSGPVPEGIAVEEIDAGGVSAVSVLPSGADESRVLVYLHGGGLVLGSPETVTTPVAKSTQMAGVRGLLPRYRLAPEHLYPAQVEDVVSVYRWLLASGVKPEGIVMAGESAGGGLLCASLLALRDAGEPMPAGAIPISPMVDFEFKGDSWKTNEDKDGFVNYEGASMNVPIFMGDRDPAAESPINQDLAGLPPLLIQVGTAETLLDDARRLAEKARTQGVDVQLEPWEGMIHVWQIFAPLLEEARQAIDRIGEFVRGRTPRAAAAS